MQKLVWNRSLGSLAAALAVAGAACADSPSSEPQPAPATADKGVYRTHDNRAVSYAIASEAKLRSVTVSPGARTTVDVETEAPLSLTSGGPLSIEVRFSDGREVALVRNFEYPSATRFERAAVLDTTSAAVLGAVDVDVVGDHISLTFDGRLVSGAPTLAISRYLPSAAAVAAARSGLESEYASVLPLGRGAGEMVAAVPFAGKRTADRTEVDGFVVIARDIYFGPPDGTTNFDPTTPIIQVPTGDGNVDMVDLEGDYDTGYKDCAGNKILCGWFTWKDRVSFIGGCGADKNGNGKLDGDEIENWFGYCKFPSAVNSTWQDEDGYVHWKNVGRGADAGKVYEYILDPTTGELEVWYSTDGGTTWTLVYEGQGEGGPGGWDFFPKPKPKTACVATDVEVFSVRPSGTMGSFHAAHLAN